MLRVLVLAALAGLLLSPGLISGPSLDAAVFTYVGERVTEGARLYADVWDHKPPGVYYVYAVFQFLLPFLSPWLVTWLVSWFATTIAGVSAMVTMRRLGVAPTAAFLASAGVVAAMAQYLTALGGGLTEPLATMAASLALALVIDRHVQGRRTVLVGALLGTSMLLSLILLPAVLAVAAVAIACASDGRTRFRHAVAVMAGAMVPVAAVALQLWGTDSLTAAIDAIVGYAAAYRASGEAFGAALSGPVAAWTLLSLVFLIVPAANGVVHARRDSTRSRLVLACCAWIGLSVITFPLQGRFLAHYAIPLAVPLGILAGFGLNRAMGLSRQAAIAPFALALGISVVASVLGGRMEWNAVGAAHQRSVEVAHEVRSLTEPSDAVLAWGNAPQLYLDADRASALPYSYLYPLTTPGYTTPIRMSAVLADLEADPPRVVVDAGSRAPGVGGFLPLLIDRPVGSDGRTLDLMDPIRDFVRERYDEYGVVDGWVVYVLRVP